MRPFNSIQEVRFAAVPCKLRAWLWCPREQLMSCRAKLLDSCNLPKMLLCPLDTMSRERCSLSQMMCVCLSPPISQSHSDFHADLFPDTAGPCPALTAQQWAGGMNASVSNPPFMIIVCPRERSKCRLPRSA